MYSIPHSYQNSAEPNVPRPLAYSLIAYRSHIEFKYQNGGGNGVCDGGWRLEESRINDPDTRVPR